MAGPTLYQIVGMGHSGSTLVSAIIGSHPSVSNVGELDEITALLIGGKSKACSCGKGIAECDFWVSVNRQLSSDGLSIEGFKPGSDNTRIANKVDIVRAVLAVSGKDGVVDSAKFSIRTFRAQQVGQLRIVPIFLWADPRKFVYSYVKKHSHNVFKRSVTYNLLAWSLIKHYVWSLLKSEKMALLRYEELAGRPDTAIPSLCARIGLQYHPAQASWTCGVGHSIGGNRMRFATDSSISVDLEWRSGLSHFQKTAISLLCLPSTIALRILTAIERRRSPTTE